MNLKMMGIICDFLGEFRKEVVNIPKFRGAKMKIVIFVGSIRIELLHIPNKLKQKKIHFDSWEFIKYKTQSLHGHFLQWNKKILYNCHHECRNN